MMKKKIVVLGSLNTDFVADVSRLPVEGESMLANGFGIVPGGKGANQACTLSKLGADVTMLGAIGKDGNGQMMKDNLEKSGVDCSHLLESDVPTGIAMITVFPNGNNSIVVAQGANMEVDCAYIDKNLKLLADCDALVLQLEIPLETVAYAAKKAKELGKLVILDPAPAPAPETLPKGLFETVDLVKPNETELAILTGMPGAAKDPAPAAARLKEMGAKEVLVTLGGEGSYLSLADGTEYRVAPKQVPVVDTTAAGDAFTASVAIQLAEGKPLTEAAEFANKVSSIVVTRKGAQSSIPTMEEVLSCHFDD